MAHINKPLAQMKVLAADDNDINREFMLGVLAPAVAELKVVEDGAQALSAALESDYDVLLLDQHMPGHDGLQVMQALLQHSGRSAHNSPRPLFIAITADARKTEQDRLLAAGFDGFLTKPIAATQLIHSIALINEHPGHALVNAHNQQHVSDQLNDKLALHRLDNDRELLYELRQKLLAELPGTINQIKHCCQQQQWQQAAQLAHKLCGGAACISADMLVAACQQLEASVDASLQQKQLAHLHFREQALKAAALIQWSLQHRRSSVGV